MASTTLTDKIKEIVLNDLKHIDLDRLNLYANKNHQSLQALHQAEILDNHSIEYALGQAVLTCGKRDYHYLMRLKHSSDTLYPDHLIRPEFFVYAIETGVFTEHELSQVQFDHGDTLETFKKSYRKDKLLETLRTQLLNPTPAPYLGDDLHGCC